MAAKWWCPESQGCCGALHLHSGMRDEARKLACRNIDAVLSGGFDAIITNAAGCGSTFKEYGDLLEGNPEYAEKAREFSRLMRDVTEFLSALELNPNHGPRRRHRHLSGFLPPGPRSAHPQIARASCSPPSPGSTFAKWPAPISAAAAPASITSCKMKCPCRSWPPR